MSSLRLSCYVLVNSHLPPYDRAAGPRTSRDAVRPHPLPARCDDAARVRGPAGTGGSRCQRPGRDGPPDPVVVGAARSRVDVSRSPGFRYVRGVRSWTHAPVEAGECNQSRTWVMIVTGPFSSGRQAAGLPRLPTPPSGWPIGSYATYEEAQRAVDYLADNEFQVQDVTIVGVDLMLVERVIGKLSWGRVLGTGALSGAWFGFFVGVLLIMVSRPEEMWSPVLLGLVAGVVFGAAFAAMSYAFTRGRRDFSSASQLVAGRYDVLCRPRNAEKGRDLLARLAMGSHN